ncbi:MAG: DUF5318 family protein [Acidimicrobiales bacterium]
MSFTPSSTTGGPAAAEQTGVVSYRLARQRMVDAFANGRRTTEEICDAQPELRRVAHAFGASLSEPCPICEGDDLVTVSFAFGPGLPKAGRVLADLKEIRKLRSRGKPSTCYLIEVCRQCWWNHLRESYGVPG